MNTTAINEGDKVMNSKARGTTKIIAGMLKNAAERGLTRKQAADELGVCYATVSNYSDAYGIAFNQHKKTKPFLGPNGRCQMAVRVPPDVYERLEQEASNQGVPTSRFVSNFLTSSFGSEK